MKLVINIFLLVLSMNLYAQEGWWRGELHREDGKNIVFNFEWLQEKGGSVWHIRNASEWIRVTDIRANGDSVIVQMPLFESQFRLKQSKGLLQGVWIKGGSVKTQIMPFVARPGKQRFLVKGTGNRNINGRWAVVFKSNNVSTPAVAEFKQEGNQLSGTFLNPTGDYRYLEGVVNKDSLEVSCFDGGHAYLFTAVIANDKTIKDGFYYSGAVNKEAWTGVKDAKATLPADAAAIYLKPGQDKLNFTFNDLDGKPVSINDARFKNKVVVVQIMGSWCPNCMDETAFLSDYYRKNKQRGIEIVSLAYEYSTDIERSRKSLRKFQQRFNVQYPMLITGVTVGDSLRTEKTLPQVTRIQFFPSSIILDKKGKIRKIDTGFNGPGTGAHYTAYKKEFEETMNALVKEP